MRSYSKESLRPEKRSVGCGYVVGFLSPPHPEKNDRLTSLLVARQAKEMALVSKSSRMATHMLEDFFRRAKFTGMRIVISKLSS